MARRYGFTPEAVSRMTTLQHLMYLEEDGEGSRSSTVKFDTMAEALAFKRSKQ